MSQNQTKPEASTTKDRLLANMIQNKNLSSKNLPTESNLFEHFFWQSCKDNLTANNQPKKNLYNSICLKFGIFVSLAAAINLTGSNHMAQASDSDHFQASDSLASSGKNKTKQNQNPVINFLPRLLHFVPFSTESLVAKSPAKSLNTSFSNNNFEATIVSSQAFKSKPIKRANLLAHTEALEESPQLASPQSSKTFQLRIHRVQRGDTVNQIAHKYKVSSAELIKLNGIKNSNIIFVGQELKIPPLAIGGISLGNSNNSTNLSSSNISHPSQTGTQPLSSPSSRSQISRQNIAKVPTNNSATRNDPRELNSNRVSQDSYLAKLRAEIELIREQEESRPRNNNVATPANLVNSQEVLPTESSLDRFQSNQEKQPKTTATLDLPGLQSDLETDLIKEDVVALTLPPLPDSEEYLPSGFNGYIWPAQGVLTSGYGWRWGRMHRGIDIAAPIGTPIVAAAAGEVIGAGWHGGYGNLVKLEHLDGSVTLYAHNSKILVSHGQKVSQGEQIAEMGSTGYSTGSHLHFEIHSQDRQVLDPLALLGSR